MALKHSLGVSLTEGHLALLCLRFPFGRAEVAAALRLALPAGVDEEPAFLQNLAAFLLANRIPPGVRVTLGVPRAELVMRRFQTPRVALRDLPELVGFEMERHLPGRREEFLAGWRTEGRVAGAGYAILLGAARKTALERVTGLLRRANLAPDSIQPEPFALALCLGRTGSPGDKPVLLIDLGLSAVGFDLIRGGRVELSRSFPINDPQWRESFSVAASPAGPVAGGAAELRRACSLRLGAAIAERLAAPLFRESLPGGVLPELRLGGIGANRSHLVEKLQSVLQAPVRSWSPWALVRWGSPPADIAHYNAALALALQGAGGRRDGLEFAPELQEKLHRAPSLRLAATLAVLLVLVLATQLVGRGLREKRQLDLLDTEIRALKVRMAEVEAIDRSVQGLRARRDYIQAMVVGRARQADILHELTGLIPDGAHLTEFTYRDRVVEIAGLAPSASQLLPVIETSPLFSGVEFSAPILAQGAGLERFRIRMRLEISGG